MPRPVLFDLDGTLIDSLTDIAHAANFALSQLHRPTHDVPAYRRMVGDGADVLMQRALGREHQSLTAEALTLFKQHYAEHLLDNTRPYPGIAELLTALCERGCRIAVLTNKPDAAARHIVQQLLSDWPWAVVAGHREGIPKKPDAAPAIAIAQQLGTHPAACLFVGDSNTDMHTAVNARMIGVGVSWGFRDRAELLAAGATHVIDHPDELVELVE